MNPTGVDLPPAANVARAARRLAGRERPMVLGYHPVARMNPFQALLYKGGFDEGVAPLGIVAREDLGALEVALRFGVQPVLHLHWTSPVLAGATDEAEAERRVAQFDADLGGLADTGIKILWTVHNVLPHDCRYPEAETELRSRLAGRADAIHVMHDDTVAKTADLYTLPGRRTFTVPHPSYIGAYPTHHDRELVRYELGIEPTELVVGLLGSIQPYKGIDEFERSLGEALDEVPHLRGLVAGIPGKGPESQALVERLDRSAVIMSIPRKLGDDELSRLVTAVDAMVLPYRASLNSGVALLAVSFGVPLVGPRTGHFVELEGIELCLGYEAQREGALATALAGVPGFAAGFDRSRALAYANDRRADVVSPQFFKSLRKTLEEGAG